MPTPLIAAISDAIAAATGTPFTACEPRAVAGGCINETFSLEDGRRRYFVKINAAVAGLSMFEAEAAGLEEIAASRTIRVPRPICLGSNRRHAFLVLEHIAMGPSDAVSPERLARQLAHMHQTRWTAFGWRRDNTIGSTPQRNTPANDWTTFWRDWRLGYQLALAADNGYGGELQRSGERLLMALPALFGGYRPQPALLHGDLWHGNCAMDADGEPVVFDPAVYYGDREADIAMTELFGGFPPRFYAAYREALPLDPGYGTRKTLYNLYHVLNHLNLFGGGYLGQARRMLDQLLSECR